MKTRITLIGPMGAGKSTIGKALSSALDFRFIDIDEAIVEAEKRTIPAIFEQDGEKHFRQIEAKTIAELSRRDRCVMATGGGAILDADTRELIQRSSLVVFLRAEMSTLLNRTRGDKNRPLLNVSDPLSTMTEIYRQREPYYSSTAHLIIDTDYKSTDDVVSEIQNALQ